MGILRLLLALSVVAVHCGSFWNLKLVEAQIAVQSFYIISGFYMTLILNEKYSKGYKSFKLFITNRVLRLYPIYWVVLIATVLTYVAIGFASNWTSSTKFDFYTSVAFNVKTYALLIFSNLFIIGQDLIMFLGVVPDSGKLYFLADFSKSSPPVYNFLFIEQAWTLGLEIMFYLAAPFIVRRKLKTVGLLILLSIFTRLIIYNHFGLNNDPWTYRFFPNELCFFLLGTVSYHIYKRLQHLTIPKKMFVSVFIFVILITVFYQFFPGVTIGFLPFTLKEIFYFCLVALSIPFLFILFKNNRFDNEVGDLSYPVYISHILVFMILKKVFGDSFDHGWIVAVLTIVFSFGLNLIISKPIDRYRQLRVAKFKTSYNKSKYDLFFTIRTR
ncbi:MAG: acyltransferase [Chitinophagaceae bacterium]|nr:acyltransferase [Chitinophagaceae bacterium]